MRGFNARAGYIFESVIRNPDNKAFRKTSIKHFVHSFFFTRSLFSDLLGYWQYLNVESTAFGKIYMDAIRKQEGWWTLCFLVTGLLRDFIAEYIIN
jgi:hypothetical protein